MTQPCTPIAKLLLLITALLTLTGSLSASIVWPNRSPLQSPDPGKLVEWSSDVGGTPDVLADGLTAAISLDGVGLYGKPLTVGKEYSVNASNGMGLNTDQSLDRYMIIDIGNSITATFGSLDILVLQKNHNNNHRVFRVSYLVGGEGETFLNAWTAAPERNTGATAASYDFADFTTEEDVEFRVYWGGPAQNNGAQSRVYLTEFVLNGQVAVPEPTTAMLLLLGMPMLARRRRI